jgi:glyoxylase-like metal-dependent hydrolase (beta-lactamase superfamily II)
VTDASIDGRPGGDPQRAHCVTADNPGSLTLDGTNTWILAEPGASRCVVVDPGPPDPNHLAAVLAAMDELGVTPALAVVTHHHLDHTGNVDAFCAATGAPVRALDPAWCRGTVPLVDGDWFDVGGMVVEVLATPGHTRDSLALLVPVDGSLVTGDTVLGRGTALVAHPDGRLDDYLSSLRRLRALAAAGHVIRLLPGHGPQLDEPLRVLDVLWAHREDRLEQVQAAMTTGAGTVAAIADAVYGMPGPGLREAVDAQVRAQLVYLSGRGVRRASEALARSPGG